jgi:acyl carrier protein
VITTEKKVRASVVEIIKQLVGKVGVKNASLLKDDLNIDDFLLDELVEELQVEFDIDFTEDETKKWETLRDIFIHIKERLEKRHGGQSAKSNGNTKPANRAGRKRTT